MRLTEVYEITKLIEWLDDSLLYGKGPVELHVTPRGWEFRQEGADPHLIEPDYRDFPQRQQLFNQEFRPADVELGTEDGGQARIATIEGANPEAEAGTFVRFQSWDPNCEHADFERFLAADSARVTIEVFNAPEKT